MHANFKNKIKYGLGLFIAFILGSVLMGSTGDQLNQYIKTESEVVEENQPVLTVTVPLFEELPTAYPTPSPFPSPTPLPTSNLDMFPTFTNPQPKVLNIQELEGFSCDCSKTCAAIVTCEEAQYLLNSCGCTARDGDHDGIACDQMCQ